MNQKDLYDSSMIAMLNEVIKQSKTKNREPTELWEAIVVKEKEAIENKGDVKSDMAREAAQIMCKINEIPIENQRTMWQNYYNIFEADNVFSVNVYATEKIKTVIHQMSNLDRLPKTNSMESLTLLRFAQDHIDVSFLEAGKFKKLSIRLQVLLLVIGAILTCLGVVCSNRAEVRSAWNTQGADLGGESVVINGEEFSFESNIRKITLQLSLVQSFVAGQFSYMNPVIKWKQMKAAHQGLTSEVWKQRTRAEKQSPKLTDTTAAETALKDTILRIKQQIVDKSTITEVNQARHYPLKTFTHNQYADAKKIGNFLEVEEKEKEEDLIRKEQQRKSTKDSRKTKVTDVKVNLGKGEEKDHLENMVNTNFQGHSKTPTDNKQCPVNPELYIQLRLKPSMKFYQSRLPGYQRRRNFFQFMFLVGTAVGGLLAFLEHTEWVALATIMTSSITAWMEFHGTESKISRQNSAVHGLDSINLRWYAKSDIERSRPYTINMLIIETENIMAGERNAWLSTQSGAKDKNKAAESDDKSSNK